jgi:hypothetical protein
MMRRVLVGAMLLGLTACVAPPSESWVEGELSPTDTKVLVASVVEIARQRLPPATSTILVAAPPPTVVSPFPDAVADGLRKAGFAVAAGSVGNSDAHPLRYQVTTLDGQVLLRVSVDATMTAQLFVAKGSGPLTPASPRSVQKAAAP